MTYENIKEIIPISPRFKFWEEYNLHDIINGVKQEPFTKCFVVGSRYMHRDSNVYGWEYFIIKKDFYRYQWVREENLSKIKKEE